MDNGLSEKNTPLTLCKKTKMTVILGDGLLGSYLYSIGGYHMLSRKKDEMDITQRAYFPIFLNRYDTVVNCMAYTDTYSKNRNLHWDTNYVAVHNLAKYCQKNYKKLVHISTDFVYANSAGTPSEEDVPVHNEDWYSYTKLLGDAAVQMIGGNYLVCRCTHKPFPFMFDTAWTDRIGNFDYTKQIGDLIHGLIQEDASGVYNVGTKTKSMFDLAQKTNPNVKEGLAPSHVPKKTTMNVGKLNNFLKLND